MTNIFNYDDDGHYTTTQVALVDEFGKLMLPENATFNEPLQDKEGFDVVFNGENWEYKEIKKEKIYNPTKEDIILELKNIRKGILSETDTMVATPDYPITAEEKALLLEYREYLRHLPETEGYPYENGEVIKVKTFEEWKSTSEKLKLD